MSEPPSDQSIRDKWNDRYRSSPAAPAEPARVLADFEHLLPGRGTALDLACGLGANALLLAGRGLHTHAWDLSDEAIGRLQAVAAAQALPLHAEVRNVIERPPAPESFEVIVVAHFLERELAPRLVAALRPGGLLYFQTFTRRYVHPAGPAQALYRLDDNELLALFRPLRVLAYREEGTVGDPARGFRDEAMLVGMKV